MTEYVLMPGADYQNICNALRKKTGSTELIRSGEIPGEIENLPDNDHYDVFWDTYQQNGLRTNYDRSFAGTGWTKALFEPKYKIIPTQGALYMAFAFTSISRIDETVLDLTNISVLELSFYGSNGRGKSLEHCEIDIPNVRRLQNTFQGNTAIETVVIKQLSPECVIDNYTFYQCTSLKNLQLTGAVGKNLNLSTCPNLTDESVASVLEALADLSDMQTQTLSFQNGVGSRLTDTQKAIITARNWTLAY